MARTIGRLTSLKVERAKEPGMYADGAGLFVQVTRSAATSPVAKSWVLRFSIHKKAREMGLGSYPLIGLAEARAKAAECRRLCQEGIDPIEARRALRERAMLDAAKSTTFRDAAAAYIASHRDGWRNAKHIYQWESTLATYAYPFIGKISVQAVDTVLVEKVLRPIWSTKTETASRLRGRIEAILDWAKTRGLRQGENPARWRGHLENMFPLPSKVRRVEHHPALPYDDLPGFLIALREQGGVAPRALEFTILAAARTGETIGATTGEVNSADKLWTVPAERMKAGKEHRVPLSTRAVAIVNEMGRDGDYVFPGGIDGKALSNMAMTKVLRRMGREDITVHGFRSTFRDWAAERTNFPNEVVEMALAHAVGDKVEAAYRRGDLFDKRRRLMDEWAAFCNTTKPAARGKVVPLRSVSADSR